MKSHFINCIAPYKSPSGFSGRNKSVRLLGRSDSSQQTAMPTVTRVVSILKFTIFQKGDTTFYRQISRKHRFQRLCRYILSDFQGFINIGVTTFLIPNTGLSLPFVSYGLTSLWSLCIGMGFVLNVRLQAKR